MKQILLFLCMVMLAIGIDFHGVNFQKLQKSTGLDIRTFDDAMTLKIALMVNAYMKELERRRK